MSDVPDPTDTPEAYDLQFDKMEKPAVASAAPAQGPTCIACRQPIRDAYYAAGNKLICPRCRDNYVAGLTGGSQTARLAKATLFGIGAGLLGAAIWYAVRRITHYEIGLIAVVVGFLVGRAVRAGSANRGGRGYQILAVVLTYGAIATTYVPDMFEGTFAKVEQQDASTGTTATTDTGTLAKTQSPSAPGASSNVTRKPKNLLKAILGLVILVALVFVFSLAFPILHGIHNPIGLLIAAFALWEAWKINARRTINLAGPYSISAGRAPIMQSGGRR
jgi:hypothetical protein